jgi:hypothetical protein
MRGLISHLRYTIRLLLKSPGFTITAVLILGFGIGTNTAVFSLIDAVVLKPLPFPHSERLVELFMPLRNDDDMPFDYPTMRISGWHNTASRSSPSFQPTI